MYKVVRKFKDRDGKEYAVGDIYEGDRVGALSTRRNKYKKIYIEKMEKESSEEVGD